MSLEAYDQYQLMIYELDQFQSTNARDVWSYAGGSISFTLGKLIPNSWDLFQCFLFIIGYGIPIACQKGKWLVLKDRLKRKNMQLQCYDCVLCHLNVEESSLL
jgi:hypothetical protein